MKQTISLLMIQGRRFAHKTHKELSSHERLAQARHRSQKSMQSLYRLFQRKYSWYFAFALVAPLAVFVLPCLYFLHQNYEIFQKLAYDVRPELVSHLQRETQALTGLFFVALGLSITSCYFLTRRLTSLMIKPVSSIERHMKHVTAGDWSQLDFKYSPQQEFQSLSGTYSYLYRTLRVHNQKEVESLEKLVLTLQANSQLDKNSEIILKNLILTKRAQLGAPADVVATPVISVSTADLKISSFPSTRRAS